MGEENKNQQYNGPVRAIVKGISDLFRKPVDQLLLPEEERLDGRRVLITGSSSGLGLATAVELARRGAHVIMAVRSGIPEKGTYVKKRSGSDRVEMIRVDLSDPASIENLAREVKSGPGPIDILICNAAVVTQHSRQTGSGLDEMFMVNYLSKFLLIKHLLDKECFSTSGRGLPRIIVVNSESHRNPEGIDWEGFGRYEPYGIKKSVSMYGYYKLLLLTMVNELSRRLNPADQASFMVSALCPGPVNSNIAREAPALFQPLLKLVFRIFFRSPEKACRPVTYLACSGEQEGKPMEYLFLMQRKEMDEKATSPENGRRLWELTEKLVKGLPRTDTI
jgi:NAD(P)-dependent dehydrogenase (short-subunit alcohol dehydrogenase family)